MQQKTFDFTVLLLGLAIALILLATSCTTSGYGCHGRSKDMTGTSHRFNK